MDTAKLETTVLTQEEREAIDRLMAIFLAGREEKTWAAEGRQLLFDMIDWIADKILAP